MLRPDPAARGRLTEIIASLADRISEARVNGWLGEVEGFQVSLAAARAKLAALDRTARNAVPRRPRHARGPPRPAGGTVTTTTLATALTSCAAGLYPLEAGIAPAHRRGHVPPPRRLHQPLHRARDQRQHPDGRHRLGRRDHRASRRRTTLLGQVERRILAAAASIAAGIPVDLRDTATDLDDRNIQLIITAISHAAGQCPR